MAADGHADRRLRPRRRPDLRPAPRAIRSAPRRPDRVRPQRDRPRRRVDALQPQSVGGRGDLSARRRVRDAAAVGVLVARERAVRSAQRQGELRPHRGRRHAWRSRRRPHGRALCLGGQPRSDPSGAGGAPPDLRRRRRRRRARARDVSRRDARDRSHVGAVPVRRPAPGAASPRAGVARRAERRRRVSRRLPPEGAGVGPLHDRGLQAPVLRVVLHRHRPPHVLRADERWLHHPASRPRPHDCEPARRIRRHCRARARLPGGVPVHRRDALGRGGAARVAVPQRLRAAVRADGSGREAPGQGVPRRHLRSPGRRARGGDGADPAADRRGMARARAAGAGGGAVGRRAPHRPPARQPVSRRRSDPAGAARRAGAGGRGIGDGLDDPGRDRD